MPADLKRNEVPCANEVCPQGPCSKKLHVSYIADNYWFVNSICTVHMHLRAYSLKETLLPICYGFHHYNIIAMKFKSVFVLALRLCACE